MSTLTMRARYMEKNVAEQVPVVLGMLTFIGGCLAALFRWFTKLQQVEQQLQDVRQELAHYKGRVDGIEGSVNEIKIGIAAINTNIGFLLRQKDRE